MEPDDAIDGDLVESWIRVEIDPVRTAEARDQLHSELCRVLTDVRDAVDDWPRMRQRAVVIADELAAARGSERKLPVPDKDVTDSIELLKWLAHDHFTFLGYREYQLDRRRAHRGARAPGSASCAATRAPRASCPRWPPRRTSAPWRSGCW